MKEHDNFNFPRNGEANDTEGRKALDDLKSPGVGMDEDGELKIEFGEQTFSTRPRTVSFTMKSA